MDPLQVTLAGALTLRRSTRELGDAAFAGRQLRLVTAMLVLERANPVPIDALANELWPDTLPARWRVAVRGLVSKVRRAAVDLGLASDAIVAEAGAYRVELGPVEVDLEQASAAAKLARLHLDAGRVEQALEQANRARAVLSRPVVPGVRSNWLDGIRDLVAGQHLDVLIVVGTCRSRLGRHDPARLVLSRAVEAAPSREDAWRALMSAEAAAGNTAAALAAYERCRRHLVEELGVDPSEATQRLHAELLESVPTPVDHGPRPEPDRPLDTGSADSSAADVAPYIGLRPFQRADADRFFGRDAEVQELVTRLVRHGIVAVVGPSGSGKSSLVRAGLLPALERGAVPDSDTWVPVVATPGSSPLESLAAKLAALGAGRSRDTLAALLRDDPDGLHLVVEELLAGKEPRARLLLVIDQLEELFTLGDEDQAEALVAQLTAASRRLDGRVVVVVTLRADFYEQATGVPGLADLLSRSQFVVPPLLSEQVEEVVERPARRAGVTLERGLLARIIADVTGQPGALPLLQHLLYELWQQRTDGVMTLGAYADLGGVAGALAKRAEAVYTGLDQDDRAHVRRVLLRGVQPSEDGADARRPIPESEWALGRDQAGVTAAVSRLVEARLLTAYRDSATGERMVELAHEALIDGWPRLRAWVDEARVWLLDTRRLASVAADWERHDRHDDWLLSGGRLDAAEELLRADDRAELDLQLPPPVHALVQASLEVRDDQRREHLARRRVAGIRALVAESRAALDDDPQRALLLALVAADRQEAVPEMPGHPVDDALHRSVAAQRERRRFADVGELVAVHPRGASFVTVRTDEDADQDALFDLRHGETGELLATLPAVRDAFHSAAFSPDGELLATGAHEPRLRVWSVASGEEVARLHGPDDSALWVWGFDPTGRLVVAGDLANMGGEPRPSHWSAPGVVPVAPNAGSERGAVTRVWDLDRGEIVRTIARPGWLEGRDPGPSSACFSPDGTKLAICIWARRSTAQVVDLDTGTCLFELPRERGHLAIVAWSPDGRWLALAGDRVTVVDVSEGRVQATWTAADGLVAGLAWAADSRGLFVGTRKVQRWNAPLGWHEVTFRASGRFGPNNRVFATTDGRHLFSGSRTGATVRVWDVSRDAGAEVARVATDDQRATPGARDPHRQPSLAWSPDGGRLVVSRPAGCGLVDATSWQDLGTLASAFEGGRLVAWSADGTRLGAAQEGGFLMWNPMSRAKVFRLVPEDGRTGFDAVCFTPDGRHVAVSEWMAAGHDDSIWADGYRVRILDRDGLEVRCLERRGEGEAVGMQFSADGGILAVARYGGLIPLVPVDCGIDLWDWQSGTSRTLDTVPLDVAFDPRGQRLVTGGLGGQVELWNLRTATVESLLEGHTDYVNAVAWSADGRWVGTGSQDATVRLWDATTGDQVLRLDLQAPQGVTEVRFSPDGRRLAAGQEGQGVWVWTLDRAELVSIAQARVNRPLTDEERREYVDRHAWPADADPLRDREVLA